MKTSAKISSLMILALALLVSGCGGAGKTSASLEVVNGFLVSANGYDGGLIIYGKKDTGEEVSVTLTNSLTTTLELPNGTWIFKAVGWEGDNVDLTKKFFSTPRCGSTTAVLNGGDMAISLGMDSTKCDSDLFAAVGYRDAGSFRQFSQILALKALMKPASALSDTPALKTFTGTDTVSSININMPDDLRADIKSIRFIALKKDLASSTWSMGFASKCINASTPAFVFEPATVYGSNLKLPTRGIPLGVELYEEANCSDLLTTYEFPHGLESASNGDHLFHMDSSSKNRLILAGTDLRKGYSATFAHMPYVKCHNGTAAYHCYNTPSPVPDFILHTSTGQTVNLKDSSCGTPAPVVTAPLSVSCTTSGDGINLTINASAGTIGTVYTLTVNGKNYILGMTNNTVYEREKYTAFKDMIRATGAAPYNSFKSTFLDGNNGDEEDSRIAYGRLGRVREHLSPAGAMGLFGIEDANQSFQQNCLAVSGSKQISLPGDDGDIETYRVDVSTISVTPDTYTCSTTNPNATACGSAFDKKIKVYNLNQSSSVPEMTYAIDCDALIGKFESNDLKVESDNNQKRHHQLIISWNTDPSSNLLHQRYEFLSHYREWDLVSSAWVQNRDYREAGRVFKTGIEKVQLMNFEFHSWKNAGVWEQALEARNQIMVPASSLVCIDNNSQATTNASLSYILTDASFSAARATQVDLSGATGSQMLFNSTWQSASAITATTSCTSTHQLQVLPSNNATLNGSLPAGTDALADGQITSEFGSFLNF